MINYLFSNINTETGFTNKQKEYLKKDIKNNSVITFLVNDESLVKEVSEVSKYQKIYCLPNESFIKIENDNIIIEGPYYILGE